MSTDGVYQNDLENVPRINQYNFENLFKVYSDDTDGSYYYNISNSLFFPEDLSKDVYYEYRVKGNGMSWTYLSYIHYGTIKLWWLLCSLNNVDNPMDFPKGGTIIKVLHPTVLRDVMRQIQENK